MDIRSSSTIVSLQMPSDQALQLMELIEQGKLQAYGILEASLSKPSTAIPRADSEAHSEPRLLTRRQQEIVQLVAQGLSNKEIAHNLGISRPTVNTHIGGIFDMLSVRSRVEIAAAVLHPHARAGILRFATPMLEIHSDVLDKANERFQQHFDAESEIDQPKKPDQEASAQSVGYSIPPSTEQSPSHGSHKTEREALEALQEGNEAAWALFTDEWTPRLLGYLQSRLPSTSDAEDVLSEILVALVRAIRTFDGNVTLATLCYSIANRKVAEFWRRHQSTSDSSGSEEFDAPNRSDVSPFEVLTSLPQPLPQALLLRYAMGLSIAEIAQVFRRSYKATESLLRRARTQFAQEFTRATQTQPVPSSSEPTTE